MFESVDTALWLIPLAPLAAAVAIALLGPWLLRERSHWLCAGAIGVSLVTSLWLLFSGTAADHVAATGFEWVAVGGLDIRVGLRADQMTALMLVTVTSIRAVISSARRPMLIDRPPTETHS